MVTQEAKPGVRTDAVVRRLRAVLIARENEEGRGFFARVSRETGVAAQTIRVWAKREPLPETVDIGAMATVARYLGMSWDDFLGSPTGASSFDLAFRAGYRRAIAYIMKWAEEGVVISTDMPDPLGPEADAPPLSARHLIASRKGKKPLPLPPLPLKVAEPKPSYQPAAGGTESHESIVETGKAAKEKVAEAESQAQRPKRKGRGNR